MDRITPVKATDFKEAFYSEYKTDLQKTGCSKYIVHKHITLLHNCYNRLPVF